MIYNLWHGATLQIVPHQGVVFLRPMQPRNENLEEDGPLLYGHVVLSLPRPKYMERIVVRHVTNYLIAIPGHDSETERGTLQEDTTEISINSKLDKGEHRFSWSLHLPATSLPYERNMYGRVTHQLHASAPGAGLMRNDLEATARVKFVLDRNQDGRDLREERRMEGFVGDLGPYSIVLKSPHMTVGGLVQLSIDLPCVAKEIRVHCITLRVWQRFKILPPSRRRDASLPESSYAPLQAITVMTLDHDTPRKHPTGMSEGGDAQLEPEVLVTPNSRPHPSKADPALLAVVPVGDSLKLTFLTRLPRDRDLRPTMPQAEADARKHPMSISHELRAEIRYWTPESKERVVKLSQPIEFASCCCLTESLTLPCYSPQDCHADESAGALPHGPSIERALGQCACEMSTEDLLGIHGREAFEVRAPVTVIEQRPKAVYVPASASSES